MQNAPIHVLRGRTEAAVHRDAEVPDYAGNPLIEALPPILDPSAAADAMAFFPSYAPDHRRRPGHLRLHHIEGVQQFFEPLDCHIDLEQRFSRMIRGGYLGRNPAVPGYWAWINRQIAAMGEGEGEAADVPPEPLCGPLPGAVPVRFRAMANGFHLIGLAGTGKTTGVERVLLTYPQLIRHRQYRGQPFTHDQIVWLRLSCPFDGSVRGLCDNLFQAIDDLCGTRYAQKYGGPRRTTDEMMPNLARVCACHSLGVLVIDEVQNLRGAKPRKKARRAGSPEDTGPTSHEMLKFFVQLINTLGLPIVLIGTYAAQTVLTGELHSMRRGCGQGGMEWKRMEADQTWWHLLESLWPYQYTHADTPLTPALAEALYFETQGITDFAIKVYLLAQMRAITTGIEEITEELIHSVGQDALAPAAKVLNALRGHNPLALRDLPDMRPLDISQFLGEAQAKLAAERMNRRREMVGASSGASTSVPPAPLRVLPTAAAVAVGPEVPVGPLPEAEPVAPARRAPSKAGAKKAAGNDFSLEGFARPAHEFLG